MKNKRKRLTILGVIAVVLISCLTLSWIYFQNVTDKTKVLEQDYMQFDQSAFGGWNLYQYLGQPEKAADLIEYYLANKTGLTTNNKIILHFHAGQMYASSGEPAKALEHFRAARYLPTLDYSKAVVLSEASYWDVYVECTIAFIERNKGRLLEFREILAKAPATYDVTDNLRIADRLIKYFDDAYDDAYMWHGLLPWK